jgi:hypothetical protein
LGFPLELGICDLDFIWDLRFGICLGLVILDLEFFYELLNENQRKI